MAVNRSYRYRPGTVALREIRKLQNSAHMLLPKRPFIRLVREVAVRGNITQVKRFTNEAMVALQESCESELVNMFTESNLCAIHAKRVTLSPKDIQLRRKIKNEISRVQETPAAGKSTDVGPVAARAPQKKTPIKAGDVIFYWSKVFVVGNDEAKRYAIVQKVRERDDLQELQGCAPLELSNGECLNMTDEILFKRPHREGWHKLQALNFIPSEVDIQIQATRIRRDLAKVSKDLIKQFPDLASTIRRY